MVRRVVRIRTGPWGKQKRCGGWEWLTQAAADQRAGLRELWALSWVWSRSQVTRHLASLSVAFCKQTATKSTKHHNRFTAFFRDHPGEPVPEENFWTLWCKGRLTEADTPTIRMGATPSGLSSAHLHHFPFFTGQMPFLSPNQQCQSTEGNSTTITTTLFICRKYRLWQFLTGGCKLAQVHL